MNKQKGFTLIEMAIVILIVGLAIAALSALYNTHTAKEKIDATRVSIENASSAIGNFRGIYGRYPCPASLTDVKGEVNYGREYCENMNHVNLGDGENGIYIQRSIRTPFLFQPPHGAPPVTAKPRIRVGFLPFRHLGLDEEDAYDGYGNRIIYAVTEHLAFQNSFQATGGGIEILNDLGETALGTPANKARAHFLILSPGENNNGAFASSGANTPCVQNTVEYENCDFDETEDAIFKFAQTNTSGDTGTNFDDTLLYFVNNTIPMWQLSEVNPQLDNIENKVPGFVGISVDDDTLLLDEAHVQGDVRVRDDPENANALEGKILVSELCDENGENCFNPAIFAGELNSNTPSQRTGGLECPGDDPDGQGEFMTGLKNGAPICEDEVITECPVGSFLQGISVGGEAICTVTHIPCDGKMVTVCGNEQFLQASPHLTVIPVPGGANRVENYQCLEGAWNMTSATGSCVCIPSTTVDTRNCPIGTEQPGTYTVTTVRECPSQIVTTTSTLLTDCPCIPNFVQERVRSCPTGFSGEIRQERTRQCPRWGPWITISNTCQCDEFTEIIDRDCPPNETGLLQQELNFICPDAVYVWGNIVTNTCACVEETEIRTENCPAGQNGIIEEEWRFNCTTLVWEYVQDVSNTCRSCQWTPATSGQTSPFSLGPEAGDTCVCGTEPEGCHTQIGGGQYRNYPSCICQ